MIQTWLKHIPIKLYQFFNSTFFTFSKSIKTYSWVNSPDSNVQFDQSLHCLQLACTFQAFHQPVKQTCLNFKIIKEQVSEYLGKLQYMSNKNMKAVWRTAISPATNNCDLNLE